MQARLLLGGGATALALLIAYFVWPYVRPIATGQQLSLDASVEDEELIPGKSYVFDPVVGFRGPRGFVAEITMAAFDALLVEPVVRHSNNLGFIREDDLQLPLQVPCVGVLGDSHTMGIVPTADNVGPVLERTLRALAPETDALVLNAGCGHYSLYQYVLRARTLLDQVQPAAILVIVFLGNDFLELEDPGRPHLNDALVESPTMEDPPPEQTSARRSQLAIPKDFRLESAFWQGLNQASYFHHNPERVPHVRSKARRTLELMRALATENDFEVVYALLPSLDLTFPDRLKTASAPIAEVIEGGAQQAMYEWFRAQLDEMGEAYVDLTADFRADGKLDLYAVDCHIWKRGHQLVAERAAAPLLRILQH